jgi:citrate synthase
MYHPSTQLMADVFGVDPEQITEDTGYRSIPTWDHLGHLELMMQLEQQLDTVIDRRLIQQLDSAAAIRRFYDEQVRPGIPAAGAAPGDPIAAALLGPGETAVSEIDGEGGTLAYRGIPIQQLAGKASFEEVAYLLLYGHRPDESALNAFKERQGLVRELPEPILVNIRRNARCTPGSLLRTAVSALGVLEENRQEPSPGVPAPERLIARIPTILATQAAARAGAAIPFPRADLSHAQNILHLLRLPRGEKRERLLDLALVVQAEHGCNASAFAARVVAGTGADIYSAVTVALAAFAGPAHETDPAAGTRREYRTEDPRARLLRQAVQDFQGPAEASGMLEVLQAVRTAVKPLRRHGLDVNADFHTAVLFHLLGIPADLFVPMFAASRTAGWLAHAQEEASLSVPEPPRLRYKSSADGNGSVLPQREN